MAKGSGGTRNSGPNANPQLKGAGNTNKQNGHPLDGYLTTESERKAYIMTKGGFDSAETDVILETIDKWAGISYSRIRGWQLGDNDDADSEAKAKILEKFIERMPKWHGGTTYRGMESSQVRETFEGLNIGEQWDAKSLNSWSSDFGVGMSFANKGGSTSVLLRCSSPQNGTSIRDLRGWVREQEVLTSGKCRYRVVGKSYDNKGTLIVDLEPISNGKVRKE